MKKAILIITAILVGTLLTGCGQNDTELGFINDSQSGDPINDIVWADGDQSWAKNGGFGVSEATGTKIVMQTSGSVEGKINTGSGFIVSVEILFDTNNDGFSDSSSLSLNDGESNVFTINDVQ